MRSGFNTQPPEGGWIQPHIARHAARRFNTQPPEGGWASNRKVSDDCLWFQHTAARRRLVDVNLRSLIGEHSFNTQPPEGGWNPLLRNTINCRLFQHTAARRRLVQQARYTPTYNSFNTQPPEGGWGLPCVFLSPACMFQHTAARRRLADSFSIFSTPFKFQHTAARRRLAFYCTFVPFDFTFQHTAARRRLVLNLARSVSAGIVSTHSRPKAAGCAQFLQFGSYYGFNTQPPEGGWQWHSAH